MRLTRRARSAFNAVVVAASAVGCQLVGGIEELQTTPGPNDPDAALDSSVVDVVSPSADADAQSDSADANLGSDGDAGPVDAGECVAGSSAASGIAGTMVILPAGVSGWNNPANAVSSDNQYAEVNLSSSGQSHYLVVSDFRFAVPSPATITGVVVAIERRSLSGIGIIDNIVRLSKNGVIGGTNQEKAGIWPTTEQNVSYGSSSDLWGTVLSPAIVNDATFGVALSVRYAVGAGNDTASVDRVRVTVHWSCP